MAANANWPLLACLQGDREGLLGAMGEAGWSWEPLFERASDEALLPYLHSRFAALDLLDEVPAEVAEFLAAVENANRERNAVIFGEARAALELMREMGVRPVLLKGLAYFACGIYSDPGQRYLCDADFLIPDGRRDEVAQRLLAKGWAPSEPIHPSRISEMRGVEMRRGHVMLEVHSRLGAATCERVLPAARVVEGAVPAMFEGMPVLVPSAEHLLTHVILHSQVHHAYDWRIWTPVRCMVDLAVIQEQVGAQANWAAIADAFAGAGEYRTLALHLRQVRDSLGMAPPIPVRGGGLLELAWARRRVMQRMPGLRFADPYFLYATVLSDRLKNVRHIGRNGAGLRYLATHVSDPRVYARLWTDLMEGKGR